MPATWYISPHIIEWPCWPHSHTAALWINTEYHSRWPGVGCVSENSLLQPQNYLSGQQKWVVLVHTACCLGMVYGMLLCPRWPGVALSVITVFITAVSFLQNCLLGLQKWVELVPNIYTMHFCTSSSIILYWMVKEILNLPWLCIAKEATNPKPCRHAVRVVLPSSSQKYSWTYLWVCRNWEIDHWISRISSSCFWCKTLD